MNHRHHQKGMTAIGWLLVLGLIAFFALITLRMLPLYLEYYKVVSVFESLQNEPGIGRQTKADVIQLVRKRFDVNDVANVDYKDVKVKKDRGVMTVSIEYERREHLVGNVSVVASFDKAVEVPVN